MAHKRKGQLTVSGEWAKHLQKIFRRKFWKGERKAGKIMIRQERQNREGEPKRFDAVRFMTERRKRIGNETEGMNFLQLKKYFDRMKTLPRHL